jgi:hypothetical protein
MMVNNNISNNNLNNYNIKNLIADNKRTLLGKNRNKSMEDILLKQNKDKNKILLFTI